MSQSCPSCGRETSDQASWCIGCRYDFTTGGIRGSAAEAQVTDAVGVGDRAGEHLTMQRGGYSAWLYVLVGFGYTCAAWGFVCALPFLLFSGESAFDKVFPIASFVGAVPAFFTFHDRWRCIEAYTSNSLSGCMNVSIIYAPIVAMVYGNYRGLRKLSGS